MVGAPVDDALFNGLRFEALGERLVHESGDFFVRGEAQCNELTSGELVDVGELVGAEEGLEAKALFEADDAVLKFVVIHSALRGEDEQSERDDDPPDDDVRVLRPVADGEPDGKEEVEDEDGEDEKVDDRVEAMMVLEVLL